MTDSAVKKCFAMANFFYKHFFGNNPEKLVSIRWIFMLSGVVNRRFDRKASVVIEPYRDYQKVTINGVQYLWPKHANIEPLLHIVSELSPQHPGSYIWGKCVINHGDIVFDVGACEGAFAAKAVECGANVVAIEPSKSMTNLMEALFEMRRLKRPIIVNCLLGNSEGKVFFWNDLDNPAVSRILEKQYPGADYIQVTTLDRLFEKLRFDRVDFIKCDAEGADLSILEGAVNVLKRFHPKISVAAYHRADDCKKIYEFLSKLGYKILCKGLTYSSDSLYHISMLHAWK